MASVDIQPSSISSEESDVIARCFAALSAALAVDDERIERLGEVAAVVCFRLGATTHGITLSLGSGPPRIVADAGDADIEIELQVSHFAELSVGRLQLQAEILSGAVSYRGCVRRLLAFTAVLNSLLQGVDSAATERHVKENVDSQIRRPLPERLDPKGPGSLQDFWALASLDLHKSFGTNHVLRGVDVGIPEGLITFILGPSGTGKSVLIKHMTGLMRCDRGDVKIRDRALGLLSLRVLLEMRRSFGILFQDGALWASMNVYDNVALPLRQHTDLNESEISEIVRGLLAQVGLAHAEGRMPGELSGGMRKRAGFARALVLDPEFLFFDEPDSGLDPVRTALLCDLIGDTHAARGGTYVVISHDIRSARRLADYLVILWQGRVVEAGPAEHVFDSADAFVRQFLQGETTGPLGMG